MFLTQEWAEKYCAALNESQEYKRLGRGWVYPMVFAVTELPDELRASFPSGSPGFFIDLYDGACRGASFHGDVSQLSAPFVIAGKYSDWLEVLSGRESPISAIVKRKLVIKKGDMGLVLRYASAAIEMVKVAQRVGGFS